MKTCGIFMMIAFGLALGSRSPSLWADECDAIIGNVACREVDRQIGDHYCLVPDAMPIREIISATALPEVWLTLKDSNGKYLDIDLDNVALEDGIPQGSCPNAKEGFFLGFKLRVTAVSGKYFMELYPPSGSSNLPNPLKIEMTEGGPTGKRLWLSGQSPVEKNFRYYLFLRDQDPKVAGKKFPKFLYATAYDFQDDTCWKNAPEVQGNIIKVANSLVCETIGTRPAASGGVAETGVGGGGEKK